MTLSEMWILATLILVIGLVDDLRSRKVHNGVVLFSFGVAFVSSFFFRGFEGTIMGIAALLGALMLTVPLFAGRVLGGGDVKLFAVFSFCLDPASMFWTLLYSFIWGALFGLTRAVLQKNLMSLVRSTYRAGRGQRIQTQEIHSIPYTFSLLLGWFTQITLLHAGGLL